MKSDELRMAMNARVREAYAKWPSFESLPENPERGTYDIIIRIDNRTDLGMNQNYVAALHSLCANATPVGRIGSDRLVGLANPEATEAGQRAGQDVRMEITAAPPVEGESKH